MKWEALSALAEICSAVAVVVTLIYLAIQIRQNSRLIEASLAESHVSAANEITRILAAEPEAAHIFWEGLESKREALSLDHRRRFDPMMFLFVMSAYQAFRQHDQDALARADWILQFAGFQGWWEEYRSTYSEDFIAYIERKRGIP
ncbi:hypothetical protein E2F43_15625 [Seongchinamella unica]|uniref:Uncharacterized protein n=1 Tax=Seongchinamella unica TaxID=2547392 RepID=A0A4R5LNJ5_9GAMM|nr:hypothetical protein [Seongchinamella unica]TDG11801.1 hypothetical protein E2F43_15625 [Seongchinamella unica]